MIHPTIEFLQKLDPASDATFNIEHYTDITRGNKKPTPDPLSGRYPNLTLAEVEALIPKLHAINERGAGIFVARNQCTGQRSEGNVSRIRGIHADMDDVTDAQLATITADLAPSIVVQSSVPGRYQLYWQLADGESLSKAETKAINQYLAKRYGADKAAVDAARLLRLPGFKHMKYRASGKTPEVTATFHGHTYTAEEIRNAFPPEPNDAQAGKSSLIAANAVLVPQVLDSQLESVATDIAAAHPELWTGG